MYSYLLQMSEQKKKFLRWKDFCSNILRSKDFWSNNSIKYSLFDAMLDADIA